MNKKNTTHLLLAILFLIIAFLLLILLVFCFIGLYSFVHNDKKPLLYFIDDFSELTSAVVAMMVGAVSYCRLGIRMLGTNRKFFEIPTARNGAWKIASSVFISMMATLLLFMGINRIWKLFLDPLGFKASLSQNGAMILMYLLIAALQYLVAYRRKATAFVKLPTELLGETF